MYLLTMPFIVSRYMWVGNRCRCDKTTTSRFHKWPDVVTLCFYDLFGQINWYTNHLVDCTMSPQHCLRVCHLILQESETWTWG